MNEVLIQMAVLIVCGSALRLFQPGELDSDTLRKALTSLVYYLLLPTLILQVLWYVPIGLNTARIALVASVCIFVGMALGYLVCRALKVDNAIAGALILAAAFPNAIYLGLPVLDAAMGHWARGVAIQYDVFAGTPLLLTLGVRVSRYYGTEAGKEVGKEGGLKESLPVLLEIFKVPAIWAAIIAIGMNLGNVSMPRLLGDSFGLLAAGVVPLMLISLGMSLKWDMSWINNLRLTLPIVAIQILIVPMVAWHFAQFVGLSDELLIAVVLEAAMPCMVIGIILCDRYKLDTSMYAAVVTISTLFSFFTLPLWFTWMQYGVNVFFGSR